MTTSTSTSTSTSSLPLNETKRRRRIHVAIGSKNPCKIESVKSAFRKVFAEHLTLPHDRNNSTNSTNSNSVSNTNSDDNNMNSSDPQAEKKQIIEYDLVFSSHNVSSNVNDQPMGDDETLLGAKNRAMAAFQSAQRDFYQNSNNNKKNDDDDDDDNNNECYGLPDFGIGLEGGIEIKNFNSASSSSTTNNDDGGSTSNTEAVPTKKKNYNNDDEVWCMAWMAIVGTDSTICTLCKHESSIYKNTTATIATDDLDEQHNHQLQSNHNTTNNTTSYKWGISKTASFPLPSKISHLILHQNMELGHADDQVFQRVNSKHGSGTVGILTKYLINRSDYYDHALILALISFIWPEHYDV